MSDQEGLQIVRSSRRTIVLQVTSDASVVVKAPHWMPDGHIEKFILQHKDWIDKKRSLILSRSKHLPRKAGEYLYLGKTLKLVPTNITQIMVQGDELHFPQSLLFRKDKELTRWYMQQAREIITSQVEKYAQEMKTSYKEITFADTRSQWGRCTHDNRLQFSWRLIMAPLLVLNYVVIHELAHTQEKNHTQMFWMKVRNFNPSYRQQIKWLKDHGHTLTIEH